MIRQLIFRLLILPSLVFGPTSCSSDSFRFVVSQQGIDEITNFSTKSAFDGLKKAAPTVYLKTTKEPYLRPLGKVHLTNSYLLKNVRVILEKDTLGLLMQDLRVNSLVNLTAELWPLPVNEENLAVNFTMGQTYLGVDTAKDNAESPNEQSAVKKFRLKTCTVTDPKISTSAKNYWILGSGLKLGAKWLKSNFHSIICSQITAMLDMLRSLLTSTVPLSAIVDTHVLPNELQSVSLKYDLVSLDVSKGRLTAGMSLSWDNPGYDSSQASSDTDAAMESAMSSMQDGGADNGTNVQFELTENNGQQLTVWIDESIINDFVRNMKWDFLWMEDQVPVNSSKIPSDSSRFLSTLCPHCYFQLKVWNHGPPRLASQNDSLELYSYQKIKLWVVNDQIDRTSIFVSFFALFHAKIVPFIQDRYLRAKVDLINVSVNMSKSAFPDAWGYFVKDLVQDMIHGMVWPGVQDSLQQFTEKKGLLLAESCGIDPSSAEIVMAPGKFGLATDLKLSELDMDLCASEMDQNVPKELPSLGTSSIG